MHRPFVPVPGWLVVSNEFRGGSSPTLFGVPDSVEFLLNCFKTLYSVGMSDRQVVELTALLIWLTKRSTFHVPLTKTGLSQNVLWYQYHSRFCLACPSLDHKIRAWIDIYLPRYDFRAARPQAFWSQTKNWFEFFVESGDLEEFMALVEKTRNRFAQHYLGLPTTGIWDVKSVEACKKLQMAFPKSLMPWRNGSLDGFTYRFLVRAWRKAGSF